MSIKNIFKHKDSHRKKAKKILEKPLFPRLNATSKGLTQLSRGSWEPANVKENDRVRMLEAKVEFLLDEVYSLKSIQRQSADAIKILSSIRDYQISTFDHQWKDIVYHDDYLSNPEWQKIAANDTAERADQDLEWFKDKKVLDCGCGPGRYTWALSTLGAKVTAFDLSDSALNNTREALKRYPETVIKKQSILEPLPFTNDFDLVWCYGVLHHTGDTVGGLKNITMHVKSGGYIYLMIYAEPRRNNIFDYQYRHEVNTLREATRELDFKEKEKLFKEIDGSDQTLGWFDAISSEINDLYTFEELQMHLRNFGFKNIKRTMPNENMVNVVAQKK